MKATIRADGFLTVTAENDLEAYALHHWSLNNIGRDWFNAVGQPKAPVIVDLGEWAALVSPGYVEPRAKALP